MNEVTIIDYGLGNLLSVQRGFEYFGANVTVTSDPDIIRSSSKVVLPGVGAFSDGMAQLKQQGLTSVINDVVAQNRHLLGICLGMQMLLDESKEFGITKGLGIIPGKVIAIPTDIDNGKVQKIPHIGWNNLMINTERAHKNGCLLEGIATGESVYFVHSYMVIPQEPQDLIANCIYGNTSISAVIKRGNVYGCQFHPEKSGETGLNILKNFLRL